METLISRLQEMDSIYTAYQKERKAVRQRVWGLCARRFRTEGELEFGEETKSRITKACSEVFNGTHADERFMATCAPFVEMAAGIAKYEGAHKRAMAKETKGLPIYEWWCENPRNAGAGAFNLARFMANAGRPLGEYDHPAKLWKRFGYHVKDGKAQKAQGGVQLDFSPARRSIGYNLAVNLMRDNKVNGEPGPWRSMYLWRKDLDGQRAIAAGEPKTPGHLHKMALRYTVKKFMQGAWEEWTGDRRVENLPAFLRQAA